MCEVCGFLRLHIFHENSPHVSVGFESGILIGHCRMLRLLSANHFFIDLAIYDTDCFKFSYRILMNQNCLMIPLIFNWFAIKFAKKQSQSTVSRALPLPCFKVGIAFLGLKCQPFSSKRKQRICDQRVSVSSRLTKELMTRSLCSYPDDHEQNRYKSFTVPIIKKRGFL